MFKAKRFTGILVVVLLILQGCVSSGPTIVKEREFGTAVDAKGKVIETLSCTKNSGIKITILGMDVRIVDVKNGEVVYSNVYNAESGKTSYGVGGFGGVGGVGFGGALSGLSGTAMEEVARDIIVKATYDIVEHLVPVDMVTRAHNTSES
ncbi:MAG: hypothetical protein K8R02_08110 [Anaerohalosphaeraceae bacterium]|nr:hypothetical protein [Anaerohalosphaeraceae bacterium]